MPADVVVRLVGLTSVMTMPVAGPVWVAAPPGRVPSPTPRSPWLAFDGQPVALTTPSLPAQSTGVCVHSPCAAPGCSSISAAFTTAALTPSPSPSQMRTHPAAEAVGRALHRVDARLSDLELRREAVPRSGRAPAAPSV